MKPSKLQKLLRLSGSSNEHEAASAALMLAKGLREAGVDLEKALKRQPPKDDGAFLRGYNQGWAAGMATVERKYERDRQAKAAVEAANARARWHRENQSKRAAAAEQRASTSRRQRAAAKAVDDWQSWAWD